MVNSCTDFTEYTAEHSHDYCSYWHKPLVAAFTWPRVYMYAVPVHVLVVNEPAVGLLCFRDLSNLTLARFLAQRPASN